MSINSALSSLLLGSIALSAPFAVAEDAEGFYAGAGAGFMQATTLEVPAALPDDSTSAFGGYQFNSRFGVEGFYTDIDPERQLPDAGGNVFTRSFAGLGGTSDTTIAGVSAIATIVDTGQVRPFARVGMHYLDFSDPTIAEAGGNNLLIGAGAEMDLSRRWQARVEWERYTGVKTLNPDVFSARFEFRF